MDMFKKTDGGFEPYDMAALRADFPNVSFSDTTSMDVLREFGLFPAIDEQPAFDPETHDIEVTSIVFDDQTQSIVRTWAAVQIPAAVLEQKKRDLRASMVCGPLQLRKALRQTANLAAVTAVIAQAGEEMQEAWEYASEVRRTDPMIAAMAAAIGKTDDEVDAIFTLAATL